jgi:hypothetical protein
MFIRILSQFQSEVDSRRSLSKDVLSMMTDFEKIFQSGQFWSDHLNMSGELYNKFLKDEFLQKYTLVMRNSS